MNLFQSRTLILVLVFVLGGFVARNWPENLSFDSQHVLGQQAGASETTEAIPEAIEEETPSLDAQNQSAISAYVGKTLVLKGQVTRVGKSDSGNRFINFKSASGISIFIPANAVKSFGRELPETRYAVGYRISVTGQVERFKDQFQIRVSNPDQITIDSTDPNEPPNSGIIINPSINSGRMETRIGSQPLPVTLEPTGRNQWVSPAGLKYLGTDPDGLSRKDHVLRHAVDDPDRPGSHGVFDGGDELTFAWIDLAWKKIKAERIQPEASNSRETYTVPMGQRVGYLGGQTGARRDHPSLSTIFIVVRSGTSEVITAFPR